MTFAQYIVFTEEMYESAEDFPKVAVDAYPTVVIGANFFLQFGDWGHQSLVSNIWEDARANYDVIEFNLCAQNPLAG